jgi:putative membrane protein
LPRPAQRLGSGQEWSIQMMWWNDGGYGMFFRPLFMILILIAAIAAVVLLVRYLSGDLRGTALQIQGDAKPGPLDILRERFAKGEINKDEFEERRRVLES